MRKTGRRRTGLGVAVTVTVLTVSGVAFYVCNRFDSEKSEKNKDMVSVYVLEDDVMADNRLEQSQFKTMMMEAEYVPDDLCDSSIEEGKSVFRISLPKGTILTNGMLYDDSSVSDDIRIHNFPYVELSDKLQKGEYIDIRISFKNGYDYVLLSRKKIQDLTLANLQEDTENALWLDVSEEEILRMSGAVVDASLSEGSRIYAIKYKESYQKAAIVNYPVSAAIEALIENDPNITHRAEDIMTDKLRNELESSLKKQEDSDEGDNPAQSDGNVKTEDDYSDSDIYEPPKKDEIVYFD